MTVIVRHTWADNVRFKEALNKRHFKAVIVESRGRGPGEE